LLDFPYFKKDKEALLNRAAVIRSYGRLAMSTTCEQVFMPEKRDLTNMG
jgi:hypothetical protein